MGGFSPPNKQRNRQKRFLTIFRQPKIKLVQLFPFTPCHDATFGKLISQFSVRYIGCIDRQATANNIIIPAERMTEDVTQKVT